jgi:uncharacterized membrane protein (DUF2068 family)
MSAEPSHLPSDPLPASPQAGIPEPLLITPPKQRAPTLYGIIAIKLIKGLLFLTVAIVAYSLSDNDLPEEYRTLLHELRLNPERKFFSDLAVKVGKITETNVLWVAAGTLTYSLISLVEGVGLIFRARWAGYMAIAESAFFIPIEVYELLHHYTLTVFVILMINIVIVCYLFSNRHRLFDHHH